jgi:hypothetical protein
MAAATRAGGQARLHRERHGHDLLERDLDVIRQVDLLAQDRSCFAVSSLPCVWVMDERGVEAITASFSLKEHCVIFLKGQTERSLRHFPYRVI